MSERTRFNLSTPRLILTVITAVMVWISGLMLYMPAAAEHLASVAGVAGRWRHRRTGWRLRHQPSAAYLISVLAIAAVTPAYFLFRPFIPGAEFFFSLAIIAISAQWRNGPGVVTAILATLGYGVVNQLQPSETGNLTGVLALGGFFLASAHIVSALTRQRLALGKAATSQYPSAMNLTFKRLLLPVGAGFLGAAFLAGVYLGLVSLAQGPAHALELFWQDKVFVLPILLGFGVQVGLYILLKTGLHLPLSVPASATTAAGGGVSTVAMVACCAHHVAEALPLLGLTAAATFLAQWKIPFMVAGLLTNLAGIAVMLRVIFRERQHAKAQAATPLQEINV